MGAVARRRTAATHQRACPHAKAWKAQGEFADGKGAFHVKHPFARAIPLTARQQGQRSGTPCHQTPRRPTPCPNPFSPQAQTLAACVSSLRSFIIAPSSRFAPSHSVRTTSPASSRGMRNSMANVSRETFACSGSAIPRAHPNALVLIARLSRTPMPRSTTQPAHADAFHRAHASARARQFVGITLRDCVSFTRAPAPAKSRQPQRVPRTPGAFPLVGAECFT